MEKLKKIDNNDMWFWNHDWQKAEAEAQKDIEQGNVERFNSVDKLIADLSNPITEHQQK